LAEQVFAAQGYRSVTRIGPGTENLKGFEIGDKVDVAGEAIAAGMVKSPFQIDPFLLPAPTQPLQLQVQARQFATPVLGLAPLLL
jgi:hypothetical protein